MTTIRPADELGSVLAGRGAAAVLRARIEQIAHRGDHVTVDFEGVLSASPSFADELFAKLNRELVDDGRVVFENVPASLVAIARYVRESRGSTQPA
jgi:STAS-like domain of unknown function (DUF4325)